MDEPNTISELRVPYRETLGHKQTTELQGTKN